MADPAPVEQVESEAPEAMAEDPTAQDSVAKADGKVPEAMADPAPVEQVESEAPEAMAEDPTAQDSVAKAGDPVDQADSMVSEAIVESSHTLAESKAPEG